MTGGVKGPNGPIYTHNTPQNDETHSSPVISPKPQIPRTPNQAPKSILKNRSAKQVTAKPQVNKKAREKMELENQRDNLVAQLEHLLTQQQFLEHKEALLNAIANPNALPDDFTIVYIDKHGREVTVIPPDQKLQENPEQETRFRNALKEQTQKLDDLFSDEVSEAINDAIKTTSEQFDECSAQLLSRDVALQPRPDAPQRVCLDVRFLTSSPRTIPIPSEDVFFLDETPAVRTPQKVHFDEDEFSEQWINFYSSNSEKIPGQFYTLGNIRQFSDSQLEDIHNYIQLLFPNEHISNTNPGAPRLTTDLAETIHATTILKDTALESVDQMLNFWGLERNGTQVAVNPQEAHRHSKWDGEFDHNHQRITRMLNFLMRCGRFSLASNIEQAMQSQRIAKQHGENPYWANAVGRQPGQARAPVSPPISPSRPAPVKTVHHYSDYVDAYPYDECQNREKLDFYYPNQPGFVFTNFYQPATPIEIDGEFWPTTEHYYQACKFNRGSAEWKKIQSLPNADAVYKFIYPNSPRDYTHIPAHTTADEWDAKKDDVMMVALRAKAKNVPEFRQTLEDSGSALLFEVSPKDSYWGTGKNKRTGETGKNILGSMLMQVRDEINAGQL